MGRPAELMKLGMYGVKFEYGADREKAFKFDFEIPQGKFVTVVLPL